ncbi:MAG: LamG domain-containing protein [Candidatus Poribacteria bacterium]|nr:LamG domain-containing protein [Candidatus Poribacteria bacterium]
MGEWDHVAGVYADGKQMFYVNGEHIGEMTPDPNFNAQRDFLIGAGANERPVHEYLFKGIIDEVRLYNRVLDADEINAVMESESFSADTETIG